MQTRRIGSWLAQVCTVLWIAVCLALYMLYSGNRSIIHGTNIGNWVSLPAKAARISGGVYLAATAQACLGLLVFIVGCIGVGHAVLAWLPGETDQRSRTALRQLADLASAFLIGAGILSVVFLTLANHGLLDRPAVGLVLAGAIALAAWRARTYLQWHAPSRDTAASAKLGGGDKLLGLLSGLAVIMVFSYTSARISFDATALYFSDAKISALTHSIRYFVEDPFVASVFQPGSNYAAVIALFGDQAARAYSWANGLAVMILSMALASRLGFSKRALVILFAMTVTTTAMLDLMGDGKPDLAATAPSLAAVYWMAVSPPRSRPHMLLVGFLAGLAMAARPFNMLLLPLIVILFQTQNVLLAPGSPPAWRSRDFVVGLSWIAAGALPWMAYILATNWLILGDPVAFLRNYIRLQSGAWNLSFGSDRIWYYRALYPFTVSFINHGQSLGNISPLFISLLPLGFFGSIRNRAGLQGTGLRLLVAALGTLVIWLAATSMVFEIRYIIFIWIVLYMPVALWADAALQAPVGALGRVIRLAILSVLLFMLARIVYIAVDTYSPVDAQGNAHCYELDRCLPLDPINAAAAQGDRVLMLSAFRYYLRGDLFACSTDHTEYALLEQLSRTDPVAFWTEAYREGSRFVVVQGDYVEGHLYLGMVPGPANTPPWLTLVPLYGSAGDNEVSYRLVATDPPVSVEKQCLNRDGIWEVEAVPRSPSEVP